MHLLSHAFLTGPRGASATAVRPARLAVIALFATALSTTVLSVSPATATSSVRHIRIHAVLTADSNGADAATITPAQVANLVVRANSVWDDADIVFDFDPATDVETVNDTRLNNDCTIRSFTDPSEQICSVMVSADAREAFALDPARDSKIVVFFRNGGNGMTCTSPSSCDNIAPDKASSTRAGHSVKMFGWMAEGHEDTLAHELGHYLWNSHTHSTQPTTLSAAREAIRQYVEKPSPDLPRADGLNVFDGDRRESSDTPPDPGRGLWAAVKGDYCSTAAGADSHTLNVGFTDGTNRNYVLAPDRTNIMSYYLDCPFSHTITAGQASRATKALDTWNRGQLLGAYPSFAQLDDESSSTWKTNYAAVVPFMLRHRQHLLLYRDDGVARILRSTSELEASYETRWSGNWTTGYTSIIPFTRDGSPFALLYKKGSGAVKIVRFNNDGNGVETTFSGTWNPGYTHLMPFRIGAVPHALVYKSSNGTAKTIRLDTNGAGVTNLWSGTWNTNWSTVMPFTLGGQPHALLYSTSSGALKTVRVNANAQGVTTLWSVAWTAGWTHFAPFDRGRQVRLIAYRAATGEVSVDRIRYNGKGLLSMRKDTWPQGLDRIVTVRRPGTWDVLHYKRSSGAVEVHQITQ